MDFDLNSWYAGKLDSDVVFSYKGELDQVTVTNILDQIESKLKDVNEDTKRVKTIYNVLVEVVQNLYHHGEVPPCFKRSSDKLGVIILRHDRSGYRISTGNFLRVDDIKIIRDRIDQINSLSYSERRALYRLILTNDQYSEKGGGGLGIVDIARRTGNIMEYQFIEYNREFLFLTLDVLIS